MALTQERLKELLQYDPETGLFYWVKRRGRAAAGSAAGCLCSDGYIRIRLDDVLYLAHRLAWFYMTGGWPVALLDHRNRLRSDNRYENLRGCSHSQNAHNILCHSDAGVQFKGVHRTGSNRYGARICANRKMKHIGNYDTPALAAAAYDAAARELHGDFARTNGLL